MSFGARLQQDLDCTLSDSDDVIVAHCGLMTFATRLGCPIPEVPDRFIDLVSEVIGPHRTLVMPTYTFDFPRTKVFDLRRSKPATGMVAERFMNRAGVIRSPHPMNSYAALGPLAEAMAARTGASAWADGGIMAWLEEVDALYVTIGVPAPKSCSYYHRAEEIERVPYRYYKRFSGRLLDDGRDLGPVEETMFSRPKDIGIEMAPDEVERRLREYGLKRPHDGLTNVIIEATPVRRVVEVTCEVLRENPYGITPPQTAQKLKAWVEDGSRERELAELGLG